MTPGYYNVNWNTTGILRYRAMETGEKQEHLSEKASEEIVLIWILKF